MHEETFMALEIVYQTLTVKINDPDMARRVAPLDANSDRRVTLADFGGNEDAFMRRIGDALVTVDDMEDHDKQVEGVRDFFRLYGRVEKFQKDMQEWQRQGKLVEVDFDIYNRVVAFPSKVWAQVRQQTMAGSEYSPTNLIKLGTDIFTTYMKLALGDTNLKFPIGTKCNTNTRGFTYNDSVVPLPLRSHMMHVGNWYEKSADWLLRNKRLVCDDSCKQHDTVPLPKGRYLNFVDPSKYNEAISACGGCFTGEMYLKLADGGIITFEEMARLYREGEELPKIASLDEGTGKIVYQRPDVFLDHGYMESTLMYLNVDSAAGEDVNVRITDEHPLLVEQGDGRRWIKAGELKEGDQVVGEDGASFTFDEVETQAIEGVMPLYDISFSEEPRNYLVSPDGKNWIVAHNKILL